MGLETATIIALAATAASVGVGSYSAVAQADAQKDQADAQAAAANYNAKVAENNATQDIEQSQSEAQRIRDRNRRLAGTQRTSYSKGGVIISGSAADVTYDSAVQGELDYLTALYTGKVGANQQASQAESYRANARQAEAVGSNTSAWLGVTGSVLGGVASGVSAYNNDPSNNPRFKKK